MIRKTKLSKRVYHTLCERVVANQFSPARMFTATIAREMNVSRTPVREAMCRLASEGLLEADPRGGYVTKRPTREEVAELFELREILESFAAEKAAELITPAQVGELMALCEELRTVALAVRVGRLTSLDGQLGQRAELADARFHMLILEAAANALVLKTVRDLRIMTRIFGFRRYMPGATLMRAVAKLHRDHSRIARALDERDGRRARQCVARHIAEGRADLLANYDSLAQRYSNTHPAERDWPDDVRRRIAEIEGAVPPV